MSLKQKKLNSKSKIKLPLKASGGVAIWIRAQ
ncbi:hypothetical protein [Thalassobellus suaedae]